MRKAQNQAPQNKKGFTLIEMMVVMAIILTLSLLLYSAVVKAIEKGQQAQCLSNLRHIGFAFQMYMNDSNTLPYAKRHAYRDDPQSIVSLLSSYIDNPDVFLCPSTEKRFREDFRLSYIYNVVGDLIDPAKQIGAPTKSPINSSEQWVLIGARSEGELHPHFEDFANVLWLDGHVEAFYNWQEM